MPERSDRLDTDTYLLILREGDQFVPHIAGGVHRHGHGNAATAMTARMAEGVLQADGRVATEPLMDVALVGQAVLQMASLPLSANIQFMTIMATKMPFIGRG